jgi:hypothetical protein
VNTLPHSDETEGSGIGTQAMPPSHAAKQEMGAPKKEVDPRMHSAEHILTATLMAMFGCARPFTTHLEKKKSKADFRYARDMPLRENH